MHQIARGPRERLEKMFSDGSGDKSDGKCRMKIKLLFCALISLTSVFVIGCATPARPRAMVPTAFTVTKHHSGSVSVNVTGGNKTNPLWKSDIASADFSTALVEALHQSALFSSIAGANTDYRLEVQLVKVITPNAGLTLTATVVSHWQLVGSRDSALISDEYITTPFSATVGDAFSAVVRLRKAEEGAARANIAEGIRRLSELNLQK
jgi:hypothetical protein